MLAGICQPKNTTLYIAEYTSHCYRNERKGNLNSSTHFRKVFDRGSLLGTVLMSLNCFVRSFCVVDYVYVYKLFSRDQNLPIHNAWGLQDNGNSLVLLSPFFWLCAPLKPPQNGNPGPLETKVLRVYFLQTHREAHILRPSIPPPVSSKEMSSQKMIPLNNGAKVCNLIQSQKP